MHLYISRKVFEQFVSRKECWYTGWLNTADTEFCSHCLRILNYRLTLDELHSVGFWNYVNATIESQWLMRQKCISLHFKLFQDFVELGGEL